MCELCLDTVLSPDFTLKNYETEKKFWVNKEKSVFSRSPKRENGQVAQLVEQRTENPRVGGSTPSLTTKPLNRGFFYFI